MSQYGEYLDRDEIKFIKTRMLDENTKQFRGMSFVRELHECKQFYSYQQLIAEYEYTTGVLHVMYAWFDCSATTRMQFSKWLRANAYVPYTTIKAKSKVYARELDGMYAPEPTGEVYVDKETGTHWTFDW